MSEYGSIPVDTRCRFNVDAMSYDVVSKLKQRHVFTGTCLNNAWICLNVPQYAQGFGKEKDGNRGKSIGSSLVIFCYKESEKIRAVQIC